MQYFLYTVGSCDSHLSHTESGMFQLSFSSSYFQNLRFASLRIPAFCKAVSCPWAFAHLNPVLTTPDIVLVSSKTYNITVAPGPTAASDHLPLIWKLHHNLQGSLRTQPKLDLKLNANWHNFLDETRNIIRNIDTNQHMKQNELDGFIYKK